MDGEITAFSTASINAGRHHISPRELKIEEAAPEIESLRQGYSQTQTQAKTIGGDVDGDTPQLPSKGKHRAINANQVDCCTICLEPISERAVAWPCNHLTFDFICLVSWLQDHSTCPLCKAEVKEVQYDWRSPEDFKTYIVTKPQTQQGRQSLAAEGSSYRHLQPQRWRRNRPNRTHRPSQSTNIPQPNNNGIERRRRVYRNRTPSLHVGANRISQFRDFTAEDFSKSTDLQSRARAFLRRELQVFTFLDNDSNRSTRGNSREFLIEYFLAILRTNELKGAGGEAENLVAEFLGRENGRLVLHELEAWLRSPYISLEAWDMHVQYTPKRD